MPHPDRNETDLAGSHPMPRVRFGRHFEAHPFVFPVGAGLILLAVLLCFLWPSPDLRETFESIRDGIGSTFGWLYIAMLTLFLILAVGLALGPWGRIRLGSDDEKPEFRYWSWFAMLFSAGMGIGLLFFGVAEPIYHFQSPPPGYGEEWSGRDLSMAVTVFHWGLHPWALYAMVGMMLAYVGFRLKLPLTFRSLLHPWLGDRVWGRTGDLVDTFAVIATLTGVATSLGIGAQQVNAGLAFLFDLPVNPAIQVLLIAAITAVATISVAAGLKAGIRRLSELNMTLAALLLLLVIAGAGIGTFFGNAMHNALEYLKILPTKSVRTGAFVEESRSWLTSWTIFYWAWWISWSPFVGMFIARVSRGRTIREFVLGVLLVPTTIGLIWFSAFGNTALDRQQSAERGAAPSSPPTAASESTTFWVGLQDEDGDWQRMEDGSIKRKEVSLTTVDYLSAPVVTGDGQAEIETLPTVLFVMLEQLLGSSGFPRFLVLFAVGAATLCIVLFFVTSSDSASMVIDMISSGGNPDPPVGTRLFWAVLEGMVAAALLIAGGLLALQAASVAAALPLTLILIAATYSFLRALRREGRRSSVDSKEARDSTG